MLQQLVSTVKKDFPQVADSQHDVEVLKDLPVETLYLALKEAGADVAQWFYQNAAPEQIQGLIDLDSWDADEFNVERFENHFKMMIMAHPVKLGEYMKGLDPEVIVMALMKWVDVLDFDPQNPPEVEESSLLLTLDSKYALILKTENPEIREMLYLWINKFSTVDLDLLRRHLESCKWEVPSDLEEFAFQFKKGRLEDMGFVEYHEAISLYARGTASSTKLEMLQNPLDFDSKYPPETKSVEDADIEVESNLFPDVILNQLNQAGFLSDVLNEIKDAKRKPVILMELMRTMNAALVADKVLFENLETITHALQRARAYIELGLKYLSDGNKERAVQLIHVQPFMKIFHLGWLTVSELGTLAKHVTVSFGQNLFVAADAEFLTCLMVRHPELSHEQLKVLALYPKPGTLLETESILKVGLKLKHLSEFAAVFMTLLGPGLSLKETPMQSGENAFSRLATALFRQAAGAEYKILPLTKSEFLELYSKYSLAQAASFAAKIGERFPPGAQELFLQRLNAYLEDVGQYIKANPEPKVPDSRFFKALVFEL